MNQGILIYAHNNRTVDYALMAMISGGLAKKNLSAPASLITDESTVDWMKQSDSYDQACEIFDKIITVDRPITDNQRILHDGDSQTKIPFVNANRHSAWDLTPYDRTLLIDSDFFIMSNNLSNYWHVDQSVLIGESINDIYSQDRLGYLDQWTSETGVKLYWATTVMFTKNQESKLFFDTVNYIRNNYRYFSDVFRFDSRQFRNDIAFSLAKHIIDGYEETNLGRLPPVLSALDRDILAEVNGSKLIFLVDHRLDKRYCAAAVENIDIHVMNKQSIIRHKDKLLEII